MSDRGKVDRQPDAPVEPAEPQGTDEQAGRRARGKAAVRGNKVQEFGGPRGPEPTRYGDWEKAGRCIDF